MSVKHITKYHEYSEDDLNKLSTRHLINILESARGKIICSCGKGHHCGDDVLTCEEREFNNNQYELKAKVKHILKTREHLLPSTKPTKKAEKKVMKY